MSLSAAVIDALVASGCTLDQLAAAVKADIAEREAADDARKAAMREGNAERQRRFKARRKVKKGRGNAGNEDNALPPPNDIYSNPPVSSDDETPAPRSQRASSPAKPDDVDEQVWTDFRAMRKAQKAPISDTVIAGYRREAAKAGWTLNDAIAESVTRSWRGFKAAWVDDKPKPSAANDGGYLDHLLAKKARGP